MKNLSPNKNWYYLLPVLLVHLLFAGYQLVHGHYYVPNDSYEYAHLAKTILNGDDFSIAEAIKPIADPDQKSTPEDYSFRTPGYPLFLIPGTVLGYVSVISILLQNILAFFCFRALFLFLKKYVREQDGNAKLNRILSSPALPVILLILCPAHFIYSNFLMAETLLECLLLLFVLNVARYELEKNNRFFVQAIVFFTLAMLVKPVVTIFLIPVLIYFFWKKEIRSNWKLGLLNVLPIVVFLSWSYRNYSNTGVFEYSSISRHNLISYHVYLTAIKAGDDPVAVVNAIHAEENKKVSYAEKSETGSTMAYQYLLDHKTEWISISLKGIGLMMIDPGRFETDFFLNGETAVGGKYMEMFYREGMFAVVDNLWERYGILLLAFLITPLVNIFLLVSYVQFLFNQNIPLSLRILSFVLIAGIFLATGPLGASRFRVPLTMAVILFAGMRRK